MSIPVQQIGTALRIPVYVRPRASRSEVIGEYDNALKVRLAAAPVDGKANRELVKLLAKSFGVSRSAVRIESGETSRRKLIRIDGVDADAVRAVLDR